MNTLVYSLLLVGISWFAAWSHIPFFSEYSFFPLWLGYILVINSLSEIIWHDSLLRRMRWQFLLLFVASIPQWWFFEYLNSFVQNWHYLYRPISQLHYFLQSSIDFSTVIPAVLSAAFLCYQFLKHKNMRLPPVRVSRTGLIVSILAGAFGFALMYYFPMQAFPLVWVAPLLVLDPLAYVWSRSSLLGFIKRGEWSLPLSVMLATLFTGFWWEMWNFWSYPKWFYTVPYVGFWKVFEMPILGYGGYLFFGLIIFSYTALVWTIVMRKELAEYFTPSQDHS